MDIRLLVSIEDSNAVTVIGRRTPCKQALVVRLLVPMGYRCGPLCPKVFS